MTRDVLITIVGTQNSPESGENTVEVNVRGEYFYRAGRHYLRYEEVEEGSCDVIRNLVKFRQGSLETNKKGSVEATMCFETGKTHSNTYQTPFGTMLMENDTAWVDVTETEDLLEAEASYRLSMNCEFLADCRIRITVKPIV